jgi:hypothetical protein
VGLVDFRNEFVVGLVDFRNEFVVGLVDFRNEFVVGLVDFLGEGCVSFSQLLGKPVNFTAQTEDGYAANGDEGYYNGDQAADNSDFKCVASQCAFHARYLRQGDYLAIVRLLSTLPRLLQVFNKASR